MGDTESVKGFAAVGLDIFPCDDPSQAASVFRRITNAADPYGVIYITEETAEILQKEIAAFDEQMTPAIIPIPGVKGNTGVGVRRVRQSVERAVGSDIIFG